MQNLLKLVKYYFDKHCTRQEIRALLIKEHNILVSLYIIKKCFRILGLRRKNVRESDIRDIVTAVVEELYSCGYNIGYRALWYKLKRQYNLTVKRSTVYEILKIADPEGVKNRFGNRLRRRQYLNPGPNCTWHIDGYDKLKRFGFAIHGCIDGFSRKVLWLKVASTNNDPKVTGYYFLRSVKQLKLLPTIIRSDKGSENSLIESLQICLRLKHKDMHRGQYSFIQGKSIHNQRIEAFWGQVRKHSMDFYIQIFKYMQEKNLFNGSKLHVQCLQYCFGPLLTADLSATQRLWNEHKIRRQAGQNNICGSPYLLYNLPEKFGRRNYKKTVNVVHVEKLIRRLTRKPQLISPVFKKLVAELSGNVSVPTTAAKAVKLYKEILEKIKNFENGQI